MAQMMSAQSGIRSAKSACSTGLAVADMLQKTPRMATGTDMTTISGTNPIQCLWATKRTCSSVFPASEVIAVREVSAQGTAGSRLRTQRLPCARLTDPSASATKSARIRSSSKARTRLHLQKISSLSPRAYESQYDARTSRPQRD